jgi:hypothetical protein
MATEAVTPQRTNWAPVVALGLAMLVVTSEMTVAAVTLPGIGADLAVSPSATAWVLLAYALSMAAVAIPAGRWADGADVRAAFVLAQIGIGIGSVLSRSVRAGSMPPITSTTTSTSSRLTRPAASSARRSPSRAYGGDERRRRPARPAPPHGPRARRRAPATVAPPHGRLCRSPASRRGPVSQRFFCHSPLPVTRSSVVPLSSPSRPSRHHGVPAVTDSNHRW